eukprot:jgi/Undpi1/4567/HiC_scaffold_18.g07921.m1
MRRISNPLLGAGFLLLLEQLQIIGGIVVELSEVLGVGEDTANGEYETIVFASVINRNYGGVDPIDYDCSVAGKCIALLTRDGSLELDSRYGCTMPAEEYTDDYQDPCGIRYSLSGSTISSVKIAIDPDSISTFTIAVDGDVIWGAWEAIPGSAELQEIPGLAGLEGSDLDILGVMGAGEYLGILEVEIWITVDEVEAIGTSASTRTSITATATVDAVSAINTLDGDTTDSSSWTCSSGEMCDITYDLQAPESLQQLRIAFAESSNKEGTLNFMAASESGDFFSVREDIEAGGRPIDSEGFQTFGGVRALARYVKIEVVAPAGGSVIINEVELRVGDDAPARPVTEKAWLKSTGLLPLAADPSGSGTFLYVNYDSRDASDGGCDSPAHFEGCHVYYLKDGDMDSRWTCGPLASGSKFRDDEECDISLSLNYFRYVRQIQIAFHMGDEQHDEFSIEAWTVKGWVTVVASAISSGDSTGYQTFDVNVHAQTIMLVPKFQRINQWFSIKEMVILEKSKSDLTEGTVPVLFKRFRIDNGDDDDEEEVEVPTRFKFDLPSKDDSIELEMPDSTVTAVRMRFPANREFEFQISYTQDTVDGREDLVETFTSAGTDNAWETFTLSVVAYDVDEIEIIAVSGPTFANHPNYPALRVVDLQIVGERFFLGAGYFTMATTTMTEWPGVVPDITGDGVSEQQEIMTAICETKGGTFDGTDCVGELDDSIVHITLIEGDYFIDGPIFMKSGVTLDGQWQDDFPSWTYFVFYEGENSAITGEDAVIVMDGVTDAEIEYVYSRRRVEATGDIVPGTVGNLWMDVRNSKDLRFREVTPGGARTGGATFVNSSDITAFIFWGADYETGNYMEFTRVDNFYVKGFPDMAGLLLDTCNNFVWEGWDEFEVPDPKLSPPSGGDQTANVVITGNSSGIVFQNTEIGSGAEPRILMESTEPLTLENILDYEDAVSGDCIVEVPEGSSDDLVVQINVDDQTLSKSGNCWVLD